MLVAAMTFTGCSTVYYGAMEKVGIHKRDIMVDRVQGARDSQQEAAKEFTSALEQFKSVVTVKGGDLEKKYNKLNDALQRSEARANEVHDRIDAVEDVSDALFSEWKSELKQYSSQELRRVSEAQLKEAKDRYKSLMAAMRQAESKLEPALRPLRDQVLFLKHNLNAQAIGALTGEVAAIETKVDDLVRDLQTAVAEADAFIKTLQTGG
jgi:chromosome segregation ATPase